MNTDAALVRALPGGILEITLNRPQARNAANEAMARTVSAALDRFEAEDGLRVAVLTGAGGHFCAGMDLKAFVNGESPEVGDYSFLGLNERRMRKPIIAAVEGAAVAGGMEAVLACDLVVAASNARFAIAEVKVGLAALGGGLVRLPRKVPMNIAMEMALTGDTIDAPRAAAIGLVNRLTEPGQALAEALRLAETIATNAPLSVELSKRVIQEQGDWPLHELASRQRELGLSISATDDAREGARAFAEKRPPRWSGR